MLQRIQEKISNKQKAIGLLILLSAAAIVLLILPADHFDEGQSICVSVMLFDLECYGCGMTRGIQHLIHLEFAKAWEYNKLSFIAAPLLIYLLGSTVYKLYKKS